MRIYVAAPWTRKAEAQAFAEGLEKAGHTITKKWWEHREVPGYLSADIAIPERQELVQQAMEDILGVLAAEGLVLLNLEKSEGKAVETGVALVTAMLYAHGLTKTGVLDFILVGGKSNLFHCLPLWQEAKTVEDAVALLQ